MFRSFQSQPFDATGSGFISLSPYVESMEWDVYQVSVQTQSSTTSYCEMRHNGFFLCATTQGAKDSADGPPDVIVLPSDMLTLIWSHGAPGDIGTAGVWYNENPKGTTYSTAH